MHVKLGIERLLEGGLEALKGASVGLVCNQASVDHNLNHVADLFAARPEIKLLSLFGPQHGVRGDLQDNMIESPHMIDPVLGIPVYSLYSETREPSPEMLNDLDAIVFDLQDVGCRIYTFIWTLVNCMKAARRDGKKVFVCDRPNPINGLSLEGTVLDPECSSFVGMYSIPTRHGMTVCELAHMFNERWGIGCNLQTIGMEGWQRDDWFEDTDLTWVSPSPNMPTIRTTMVFPGTVHLEGTWMSEGRGTTRPFEIVGAPYIEPAPYARALNALGLPSVHFRPSYFRPTFQKHAGITCGGVQIHPLDREKFEPVIAGVAIVKMAHDMYSDQFSWRDPPYEYVFDRKPFDIIAGTASLRMAVENGCSLKYIKDDWATELERFEVERKQYLMY